MKFDTFIYLLKEGLKNIAENKKTSISSFIIIFATMIMLGVFVLITKNVENIVRKAEEQQGIQVYLELDVTEEKEQEIKEEIENIFSVKEVTYVSKEEALQIYIDSVGEEYKDLFEGFEDDNPLPASYTVKIDNLEQSKNVQKELEKIDGVLKVTSQDNTVDNLVKIANIINTVIAVVLIILIAISIFIISNSIKITMYARRKEINIMKYVGATDGFIRLPFILEGMLIGLLGALVATLVVGGAYTAIYAKFIATHATGIFENVLIPFSAVVETLVIIYVALGVGIGIIGSTMSIKKYLDV